jgi:hypothetical protein
MPVSIQSVSRRRFLQCSLAALGTAMLPRGLCAAVDVPPAATAADHLALLSDVHVSGGLFTSMARRFTVAIDQVLALPERPQRVLMAGDCAYLSGGRNDYQEYARRIGPLVAAGLPLHIALGNHDHRERFWESLPREQPDARMTLGRHSMVLSGRHADWFLLDSLHQTNKSPGELGKDQLEWLAAELDARADRPALLMLHHDPVRNGGEGSLRDSESLLAIARQRRQVKALFFGHTHIWSVAQDPSGIHLVNLPATGYTLWGRSFIGWVNCLVHGDGATLRVHALNAREKEHGQVVRLKWRAAQALR